MKCVNVKTARSAFRKLLDDVGGGEEVLILRRGKLVARLVPPRQAGSRRLPSLREFRSSIRTKGRALSAQLVAERRRQRY